MHSPPHPRSHPGGGPRRRIPAALLVSVAAAAVLPGCATFSDDGGFTPVEAAARDRLGKDIRWARSDGDRTLIDQRVAELLAQPLTVDAAVQLALLNNPGLQAAFFELRITEAEVVQAGSLPNPGFTFSRLGHGSEVERERSWHLDLARLLALPWLREAESRRFAQAQVNATNAVLALAADTRRAWVQAVAAEESLRYSRQVQQAAEASAELARRMAEAGNFTPLQRMREQTFSSEAALGAARAQRARQASRERLTRLLGLSGTQAAFRLLERLPDLPATPKALPEAEREAIGQRLDVQAARLAAEQTARNLGLVRATRLVNVLEVGVVNNGSSEAPTQRGWEVSLELPLFDWGGAKVARAESVYMQALQRAAATAVNARSEVREAHGAYLAAWDIAKRQRDELVPLKQRIAEENVLRYNGMLIGVFELLADARSQIAGVNASIEAQRDFWLADADLDMALVGPPRLMAPGASPAPAAAQPAGGGH
jgi:outer membrane protein TolC